MAAGQKADEHAVHDVLLSYNDFSDFCADAGELGGSELESGVWLHQTILSQPDQSACQAFAEQVQERRGVNFRPYLGLGPRSGPKHGLSSARKGDVHGSCLPLDQVGTKNRRNRQRVVQSGMSLMRFLLGQIQ
jgi:hypothetical protein